MKSVDKHILRRFIIVGREKFVRSDREESVLNFSLIMLRVSGTGTLVNRDVMSKLIIISSAVFDYFTEMG